MKILNKIKKNFLILTAITLLYFSYIFIFIKPAQFEYFSLIDDGQVLVQSTSYLKDCFSGLGCGKFIDQTFELGTNRFRPAYWLINNFLYSVFGNNPQLHHLFRVYVVGYVITLLLFVILKNLQIRNAMVLIGVFLFVTNSSFSENIIRLGTNEPYQVVFLAVISLMYFKYREVIPKSKGVLALLVLTLIWTLFIKENNLAILPTIFLTDYLLGRKNFKKAVIITTPPFVLLVLGIVFTKYLSSTISPDIPSYTSNYLIDPLAILKNGISNIRLLLNSLSPFMKLTLLLLPLLLFSKISRISLLKDTKIRYWFLFTIFFTLILFPWRHVLERYQLISIFGLTIIISFALDRIIEIVRKSISFKGKPVLLYNLVFEIIVFLLLANLFFRGFPVNLAKTINYATWFEGFTRFESEQVQAIARYNDEKVYLNAVDNINNWEFLYEVPIHLKFLYSLDPNIEIVTEPLEDNGYLFSRSSFNSVIELEELAKSGYEVYDSDFYNIEQIDPILFRNQFNSKPIQTILTPPLKKEGFEYYWEIRKL